MNRDSMMFSIEGVDGARPRLVARSDLIQIFAGMAQSDLLMAHGELLDHITSTGTIDKDHYSTVAARELIQLLELHTRAVNALQALMAAREPEELVEAFA